MVILGMVYGALIGDALGMATEGLTKDECLFHYKAQELTYDDIIRDEYRSHWKRGDWTETGDQMVQFLSSFLILCVRWK